MCVLKLDETKKKKEKELLTSLWQFTDNRIDAETSKEQSEDHIVARITNVSCQSL